MNSFEVRVPSSQENAGSPGDYSKKLALMRNYPAVPQKESYSLDLIKRFWAKMKQHGYQKNDWKNWTLLSQFNGVVGAMGFTAAETELIRMYLTGPGLKIDPLH